MDKAPETESLGQKIFADAQAQNIRGFVDRIERQEADKAKIVADIKATYAEAEASGFNPKVLKEVIRRRTKDQKDLFEFECLLDTYLAALGMSRK